jgi:hypothetical protein
VVVIGIPGQVVIGIQHAAPPADATCCCGALLQEPEGIEAVQQWWSRPSSQWDQSDALLAAGALVIARARAAVQATLGYSCSAGIAHSKILAKLGSGLHKPAQQTVVPGGSGSCKVELCSMRFWQLWCFAARAVVFFQWFAKSCMPCGLLGMQL